MRAVADAIEITPLLQALRRYLDLSRPPGQTPRSIGLTQEGRTGRFTYSEGTVTSLVALDDPFDTAAR